MLFSLVYDFDGFSVFFHLGVDGSFVQVGWDDAVLLLYGVCFEKFLLEFDGVVYGAEGDAETFLFLVDAREVIEAEDLQL